MSMLIFQTILRFKEKIEITMKKLIGKQQKLLLATKLIDVTGGSFGGILDKSQEEQDAYAKRAYEEIRHKNEDSDVKKIAVNTGLSEADILKVRMHLFFNKHTIGNEIKRFDESPDIALAWEALEQGRGTELDVMLVKHELEELTIIENQGYDYIKAHLLANKKYPWEYKKQGGWTDDSIKNDIEDRLKEIL